MKIKLSPPINTILECIENVTWMTGMKEKYIEMITDINPLLK